MSSEEEKNYIDTFIKDNIEKGIKIVYHTLQGSHPGKRMCYYTGYLYKDILDNFPGRTSKKIFRGYREFLNNKRLVFTQNGRILGGVSSPRFFNSRKSSSSLLNQFPVRARFSRKSILILP